MKVVKRTDTYSQNQSNNTNTGCLSPIETQHSAPPINTCPDARQGCLNSDRHIYNKDVSISLFLLKPNKFGYVLDRLMVVSG